MKIGRECLLVVNVWRLFICFLGNFHLLFIFLLPSNEERFSFSNMIFLSDELFKLYLKTEQFISTFLHWRLRFHYMIHKKWPYHRQKTLVYTPLYLCLFWLLGRWEIVRKSIIRDARLFKSNYSRRLSFSRCRICKIALL